MSILMALLELSLLAATAIGAGLLGALLLSGSAPVPVLPTITAIALVLIACLLAHGVSLLTSQNAAANATILGLVGTGIRLLVTVIGALMVALTTSWGEQLSFWLPLMASYLAVLAAELFFNVRRILIDRPSQ